MPEKGGVVQQLLAEICDIINQLKGYMCSHLMKNGKILLALTGESCCTYWN
jgi:hypothetical protein